MQAPNFRPPWTERSQPTKSSPAAVGCFAVVVLLVIGAIASSVGSGPNDSSSQQPETPVSLNGNVRFTGTQFVVMNLDSFAWSNCEFEINPKTFSSGYTYKAGTIPSSGVATVGALQFANGDGERFNPFTYKPTGVLVSCDTPKGHGYYSGEWK